MPFTDSTLAPAENPVFVVGCQRSGTTLLAVMLDRHSRIAVLPETQFFSHVAPHLRRQAGTLASMVDRALSEPTIAACGLSREVILDRLRQDQLPRDQQTPEALFGALLDAYAERRAKPRAGEKSCGHIFHLDHLCTHFPHAKVIAIVRDGRDVVRSLRSSLNDRSRSVSLACLEWRRSLRALEQAGERLTHDQLLVIRFEELIAQPQAILESVCRHIGEEYEPRMLLPEATSGVVPQHEKRWKGEAVRELDASKAAVWQRSGTDSPAARQAEFLLRRELQRAGYELSCGAASPWARRAWWTLLNLPFSRPLYPLARTLYRTFKKARFDPTSSHASC